jgi:hypothetical protein
VDGLSEIVRTRDESTFDTFSSSDERQRRLMKKVFVIGFTVLAAGLLSSAQQVQQDAFKFIALGDMPYALPADYPKFEKLIGMINTAKPEFSVHVGDIKSGSSACSNENRPLAKVRT